jgi:serine/threonine protein phosphatase 1
MRVIRADSASLRARYPPAPEGLVVYLIGDIHGRLDLLLETQKRIDRDKRRFATEEIAEVYLGDYIDRGPDSASVVARLVERSNQTDTRFLRGNHEQLLLDFMQGADCLEEWKAVGGSATLLSYGIPPDLLKYGTTVELVRRNLSEKMPERHGAFYERSGAYIRIGPYLAVHAGLRPNVPLESQVASDLLGIRNDFLEHAGDFGHIVVHGHTPVTAADLRRNRINIDTGAFATNKLTCIRISEEGVGLVQEDGCLIARRP